MLTVRGVGRLVRVRVRVRVRGVRLGLGKTNWEREGWRQKLGRKEALAVTAIHRKSKSR